MQGDGELGGLFFLKLGPVKTARNFQIEAIETLSKSFCDLFGVKSILIVCNCVLIFRRFKKIIYNIKFKH